MKSKDKILGVGILAFISIIHYGFQPPNYKLIDPVLEQIKYEYANECYSGNKEMNEFYSCSDLKKYIDKLEQQLKGK